LMPASVQDKKPSKVRDRSGEDASGWTSQAAQT
jgi:hypothetical protein